MLKDSKKPVHFIYGGTDVEQREAVRKLVEKQMTQSSSHPTELFQLV